MQSTLKVQNGAMVGEFGDQMKGPFPVHQRQWISKPKPRDTSVEQVAPAMNADFFTRYF
jgi:hypothetical protein